MSCLNAFIGLPKGKGISKPLRVESHQLKALQLINQEFEKIKGCYNYYFTPQFYVFNETNYFFKVGLSNCPDVQYIIINIKAVDYLKIIDNIAGTYNISINQYCNKRFYNLKLKIVEQVAYIQPPNDSVEHAAIYFTQSQIQNFISDSMRIISDDIQQIQNFIDSKYNDGVRKFVMNMTSSLLGPIIAQLGNNYPNAIFINTYSTGNFIRQNAPSNWKFVITSNQYYIPLSFDTIKSASGTNPILALVSGTSAFFDDVRDYCTAESIQVFDPETDSVQIETFLTNNPTTVVAAALGTTLSLTNFDTILDNLNIGSTLVVYSLDIAIVSQYLKQYYFLNADVSLKLDENDPQNNVYKSPELSNTIAQYNEPVVVLCKYPNIWNSLISASTISNGLTNYGVETTLIVLN